MDVSITCKLLDKCMCVDGENIKVLGLAELHVCPEHVGIGRLALRALEVICGHQNKEMVVGFAGDDVVDFYGRCGWYVGAAVGDSKWIISSKLLANDVVIEGTW